MTPTLPAASQTDHPAPHRDRVGLRALGFGLAAAPIAWATQLLIGSGLASHACFPHDVPLAAPIWSDVLMLLVTLNVIAIVVALCAGFIAWRSWHRTREERPGSAHHLMGSGDGRTRFLAMCGMLSSGLFLVALVFTTGMLMVVPLCNG